MAISFQEYKKRQIASGRKVKVTRKSISGRVISEETYNNNKRTSSDKTSSSKSDFQATALTGRQLAEDLASNNKARVTNAYKSLEAMGIDNPQQYDKQSLISALKDSSTEALTKKVELQQKAIAENKRLRQIEETAEREGRTPTIREIASVRGGEGGKDLAREYIQDRLTQRQAITQSIARGEYKYSDAEVRQFKTQLDRIHPGGVSMAFARYHLENNTAITKILDNEFEEKTGLVNASDRDKEIVTQNWNAFMDIRQRQKDYQAREQLRSSGLAGYTLAKVGDFTDDLKDKSEPYIEGYQQANKYSKQFMQKILLPWEDIRTGEIPIKQLTPYYKARSKLFEKITGKDDYYFRGSNFEQELQKGLQTWQSETYRTQTFYDVNQPRNLSLFNQIQPGSDINRGFFYTSNPMIREQTRQKAEEQRYLVKLGVISRGYYKGMYEETREKPLRMAGALALGTIFKVAGTKATVFGKQKFYDLAEQGIMKMNTRNKLIYFGSSATKGLGVALGGWYGYEKYKQIKSKPTLSLQSEEIGRIVAGEVVPFAVGSRFGDRITKITGMTRQNLKLESQIRSLPFRKQQKIQQLRTQVLDKFKDSTIPQKEFLSWKKVFPSVKMSDNRWKQFHTLVSEGGVYVKVGGSTGQAVLQSQTNVPFWEPSSVKIIFQGEKQVSMRGGKLITKFKTLRSGTPGEPGDLDAFVSAFNKKYSVSFFNTNTRGEFQIFNVGSNYMFEDDVMKITGGKISTDLHPRSEINLKPYARKEQTIIDIYGRKVKVATGGEQLGGKYEGIFQAPEPKTTAQKVGYSVFRTDLTYQTGKQPSIVRKTVIDFAQKISPFSPEVDAFGKVLPTNYYPFTPVGPYRSKDIVGFAEMAEASVKSGVKINPITNQITNKKVVTGQERQKYTRLVERIWKGTTTTGTNPIKDFDIYKKENIPTQLTWVQEGVAQGDVPKSVLAKSVSTISKFPKIYPTRQTQNNDFWGEEYNMNYNSIKFKQPSTPKNFKFEYNLKMPSFTPKSFSPKPVFSITPISKKSKSPSKSFFVSPSFSPSISPSPSPSISPSFSPSISQSMRPSRSPLKSPSVSPSFSPSISPSFSPSPSPSFSPSIKIPSPPPKLPPMKFNFDYSFIPSKKSGKKKKYTPSIGGIFSGKTATKEMSEEMQTGIDMRFPLMRKKRKEVFAL